MTFRQELETLKECVGSRNALLMKICIKGFGEGLTPSQVADAFSSTDTGDPPLSPNEIERAISRAKEYTVGEAGTNDVRFRVKMRKIEEMREGTSPDERSFVKRMIDYGRRYCNGEKPSDAQAALVDLAPHKFSGNRCERRRRMGVTFMRTVFPDDSAFVFATDNIRTPRDRSRIYHPSELVRWMETDKMAYINWCGICDTREKDRRCPTHIGINTYTGFSSKINGKESYANLKTVAKRTRLLVEFDMMDLYDQCCFWTGVIRTGSLDLLTLVHSGGKSLHGLVAVPELKAGDDLFGEVSKEAEEQQWTRNVQKVFRLCCSSEDMAQRCDAACRDATRMTRFPGGLREGWNDQTLVWWNEEKLNQCKW